VPDASSEGESRDVEFGVVRGLHDGAVWILDADGVDGGGCVMDRRVHSEEVHCAPGVGNG